MGEETLTHHTPVKPRVCLSNLQTQAMVSLLCTVGIMHSIDIREDMSTGPIDVTIWRNGDPTTWRIELDGHTREV